MTLLLVILCISSAVVVMIGLRLMLAPEARKTSFRKAKAVIVSRGSNKGGGFRPLLEYSDGDKVIRTHPAFSMTDGPDRREGYETDILYCPKRVLSISTQTVIMDDNGKSLQRIGWFYRLTGILMILIGFLMLIPIIILFRTC